MQEVSEPALSGTSGLIPGSEAAQEGTAPTRLLTGSFVLVCLANFAHTSSMQILLATMPLYVLELGGRETDVGLLFGLLAISALASRPLAGWAVEARGRKLVMLSGPAIFGTASLAYALITSVPTMLLVRAYHGLGIGSYNTSSSVYVGDHVPPARRGEAMGYFGMSQSLSQALGPAIGLFLLEFLGHRGLFLVSAGLSATALALTLLLKDHYRPPPTHGLQLSMFFTAKAMRPTILVLGLSFATGSVMSFVPLYGRMEGISNPGFFFTIYAVAMLICRPVSGALSDRMGRLAVVTPGMLLIASGLWLMAYSGQWWSLAAAAVLLGVGGGTVYPALLALILDLTTPGERGAAMSTFGIGMDVGIAVGSILLGIIVEQAGFPAGFLAAGAMPVVMLSGYAVAARLRPVTSTRGTAGDR